MVNIKVKWGREAFDLNVDGSGTVQQLKEQLYALTHVPIEKQKIMGLKPGSASGDDTLSAVGVTSGKTLMLIGSAEGTMIPIAQAAAVEDTSGGHADTAPTSNGLVNISNTCYLNAALQLVRGMPEMKQCLATYGGANPFIKALGALLVSMDASREAVSPLALWAELIRLNPAFGERTEHGAFMQQDAQEALNLILQQASEALTPPCANLYRGSLQQTLVCTDDPEDSGVRTELPFVMLACNVAGEVQTLETGLEQAFNEHFLARSEKLQRDVSFSKTSRIHMLPEYLIVHLVRFSWKSDIQKKAKILKPITFPLTLDMCNLVTDELKEKQKPYRDCIMARRDKELEKRRQSMGRGKGRDTKATPAEEAVKEAVPSVLHNESSLYELCGVISHKGHSADGGHYVYWGKKANQWLVFDDSNVGSVSEEDVKRLRGIGEAHIAYVLLYRSRDPLTCQPVIPL